MGNRPAATGAETLSLIVPGWSHSFVSSNRLINGTSTHRGPCRPVHGQRVGCRAACFVPEESALQVSEVTWQTADHDAGCCLRNCDTCRASEAGAPAAFWQAAMAKVANYRDGT